MKDHRLIDTAICIATEVIGTNCVSPPEGVATVAGHIVVRRGNVLTILADPFVWTQQALATFGPRAFAVAAEGNNGLSRSLVRLVLPSKAGARPKLTEFRVPHRIAYRYSGNRMTRVNVDTKGAIKLADTYGTKSDRPGNGARSRIKSEAVA